MLAGALALLALAPAPTFGDAAVPPADLAAEILACPAIDFTACPALLKAAASRATPAQALADRLQAPATPSPERAKAALALSLLDARDHLDAFEAAAKVLASDGHLIDIRAAQARLGDARAVPALRTLLAKGTDVRSRVLAAGALGVLRDRDSSSALQAALAEDAEPRLQAAAAHALGQLSDKSAEGALLALAARPKVYAPARARAVEALVALGSERAVVLASQLVDHPSRDVGRAALQLLAAVPMPWTHAAVRFGLETAGLRGEAGKTAATLDLREAGDQVLAAAVRDDLSDQERVMLLAALGRLKPQGAARAVVKRLLVAPLAQQIQILRALPELGDKTIVPDLVPLLSQGDPALANNTVYALENLTGQNKGLDEPAWRAYAGLDGKPPAADAGAKAQPSGAPPAAKAPLAKPPSEAPRAKPPAK